MSSSLYIGLMCGTSLDAIDIALIDTANQCELLAAAEAPLPSALRNALLALCSAGDNEIERMGQADRELALALAQAVNQFLRSQSLNAQQIAAIGSHGQTIRHRPTSPQRPVEQAYTLQIGDPNTIAEETGITTIADFRRRDIAAGGQGAPLVPAFHAAVFSRAGSNRVIANIGGMANITVLHKNGSVNGYDTGPGNVLMDSWIQHRRNSEYDRDGDWARSGTVETGLLEKLLDNPYYRQTGPKSTGREHYNLATLKALLNTLPPIPDNDVQATLLEATAVTLSDAIKAENLEGEVSLFLCGGGAYNGALRQRLEEKLSEMVVEKTDALGIPANAVESAAFAWLAYAALNGKPGNVPSVTGAKGARILGAIYPG
ncbi:MAG: anhydro-N-acetylmuramic acid kinase [Spongiibacter marinus]|uniref:anhydro-N-acetylmuramic acid kinase n=1 Tax=Spongiibacter marinus TaxID=354246 RepID=UPI0032B17E1F